MIGVFVQTNEESPKGRAHPVGYVIQENGCWQWTSTDRLKGYGKMRDGGRTRNAHRAMYERANGPIPEGMTLDHLCRNRGCVNPAHLEVVPNAVNVLRGAGLTAQNARKTHCKRGHLLGGDNTVKVSSHPHYRECRICSNLGQRTRYHRRKESPNE